MISLERSEIKLLLFAGKKERARHHPSPKMPAPPIKRGNDSGIPSRGLYRLVLNFGVQNW